VQIHSRRYRSGVLLATGLAAGLLIIIPVTGLAQTHPPDAGQARPAKHAVLEREAHEIAAAQAAPKPPKDVAKSPRIQRQSLPSAGQPEPQTALSPLPHQAAGLEPLLRADRRHSQARCTRSRTAGMRRRARGIW